MCDVCIIDYFTPDFIAANISHCIVKNSKVTPIQSKGHGQAIVQIIREINPDVDWGFINIGSNTTVNELIEILKYLAIKAKTKIINISFGFFSLTPSEKVYLDNAIQMLRTNKIKIVCAVDNSERISYPAAIPGVYSVQGTSNKELYNNTYTINMNKVYIREFSLLVDWTDSRKMWVHGNSFYTGIISGIFSLYEKHNGTGRFCGCGIPAACCLSP